MNKVIKNFKKDNRIQQNKSSGIRKMQTAAGGPITTNISPNIFRYKNSGEYVYQATPDSEEISVTPLHQFGDNPANWTYVDKKGKVYTSKNPLLSQEATLTQGKESGLLDKAFAFSNLHYFDTFLGAPARWRESWNNGTNPIRGLYDSPIMYGNPYTVAVKSFDNVFLSPNGLKKTIALYNNSDGSYADRWRWQASLLGDAVEGAMILPGVKSVWNTDKEIARKKIIERAFNRNFLPKGKTLSYGTDGTAHNLFVNNNEIPFQTRTAFWNTPKGAQISLAERAGVPKGERNNVNNSGNLERTVNGIILENGYSLPKETGMFAQKHSSVGSSYRKIFEKLWGKENTDRLTDDLLGKLILIRNHLIDTNIPLKGDFVYVVDGQAKAYRNGLEIGYLSNSYIDNGRVLYPEMIKKQGTNNAGVSELLYNGTILAENRPIISGSRLLMPEVTTHVWSKYPTRKLVSMEGVHAWPLRTAQERGIKLNYEKSWHALPEFSKLHLLAIDENIRTNLTGLPIYLLSEPSYLPMVKNARIFDISLLRNGYINMDFTPGFAYKQGGKMNTLLFLKNGSGIHIKKKNRGKFTEYCGGEVTDACIRKAKASGNPTLVKRATFADNARHFKHRSGGAFVEGVSILDSNPDAYKYVKKKYKMRSAKKGAFMDFIKSDTGQAALGSILNTAGLLITLKKTNDYNEQISNATIDILAETEKQRAVAEAEQMANYISLNYADPDNPNSLAGDIIHNSIRNRILGPKLEIISKRAEQLKSLAAALNLEVSGSLISNILLDGLGLVGDYLANKKNSTPESITTATPTFSYSGTTTNFGNTTTNFGNIGKSVWNGNSILFVPNKLYNL